MKIQLNKFPGFVGDRDNKLARLERYLQSPGSKNAAHFRLPVVLIIAVLVVLGFWASQIFWPAINNGINFVFSNMSPGLMAAGLATLIVVGSISIGYIINFALSRRVASQRHSQSLARLHDAPKIAAIAAGSGCLGLEAALVKHADMNAYNNLVGFFEPPLSARKRGHLLDEPYMIAEKPAKDGQGAQAPANAARREEQKGTLQSYDLFLDLVGGQQIRSEFYFFYAGQGHTSETCTTNRAAELTAGRAGANVIRDVILVRDYSSPFEADEVASELINAIPYIVKVVSSGVVKIVAGKKGGSGVYLEDQYVVTAAHVVKGPAQIRVLFPDNQQTIDAELVGSNSIADVALLHLNDIPEAAKPLQFGESSTLCLGEQLVVMGYPDDGHLCNTPKVKGGILAAIVNEGRYTLIQTDAATNPGNSGGPLINSDGQVVGILVERGELTQDGRPIQGAGYSIASNDVTRIIQDITQNLSTD